MPECQAHAVRWQDIVSQRSSVYYHSHMSFLSVLLWNEENRFLGCSRQIFHHSPFRPHPGGMHRQQNDQIIFNVKLKIGAWHFMRKWQTVHSEWVSLEATAHLSIMSNGTILAR